LISAVGFFSSFLGSGFLSSFFYPKPSPHFFFSGAVDVGGGGANTGFFYVLTGSGTGDFTSSAFLLPNDHF